MGTAQPGTSDRGAVAWGPVSSPDRLGRGGLDQMSSCFCPKPVPGDPMKVCFPFLCIVFVCKSLGCCSEDPQSCSCP